MKRLLIIVLAMALLAGYAFAQQKPLTPVALDGLAVGSAAWVDAKVEAAQPTADERKFDQIAWVTDVLTAQKLAKQHNRPIFLFAHDGRMAQGRC
jgi:hypothetical protein